MSKTANGGGARITVLVNDEAAAPLEAEHGLALWVEAHGRTILFDTGAGGALAPNARSLGIGLGHADTLVLSHGHYDHGGGLPAALQGRPAPHVYAHPAAAQPRYAMEEGRARLVGLPSDASAALACVPENKLHWVAAPEALGSGIGLTGPIPRATGYEDTGGPFFLDPGGLKPDLLEDDQALWIATPGGLVVCVGCAHAGIVNTLRHALQVSGGSRLRAVIGGFHLLEAREDRVDATIRALLEFEPDQVAPCHCTGDRAMERLQTAFGARFTRVRAGSRLTF